MPYIRVGHNLYLFYYIVSLGNKRSVNFLYLPRGRGNCPNVEISSAHAYRVSIHLIFSFYVYLSNAVLLKFSTFRGTRRDSER